MASSGPLQGMYIFVKFSRQRLNYLKKCSPMLGKTVSKSSTVTMTITDRFDYSIIATPVQSFDVLRNNSNTICTGNVFSV